MRKENRSYLKEMETHNNLKKVLCDLGRKSAVGRDGSIQVMCVGRPRTYVDDRKVPLLQQPYLPNDWEEHARVQQVG